MFKVLEFVGEEWRNVYETDSYAKAIRYVSRAVQELDEYDPGRGATLRIENGYEIVWQG
jgi:hypothetical protein